MIVILKPSIIALVSLFLGTPLHIISTGDTPYVTAALSLRKLTIVRTFCSLILLTFPQVKEYEMKMHILFLGVLTVKETSFLILMKTSFTLLLMQTITL